MGRYVELPPGRKALALETRKLIDDYISKKISFDDAKAQVAFWVDNLGDFIYGIESEYNPTFALVVGKKRLRLFIKMIPKNQKTKM